MLKRIAFLVFVLSFYCSLCFAQTTPSALDYLKRNLRIFYTPDINTKDPDISEIKLSAIAASKSTNVFGTASNNGMNLSAKLITDLFRFSDDIWLMSSIEQAMRIKGGTIKILFINDVAKPIQESFTDLHSLYKIPAPKKKGVYIWPGAYKRNDDETLSFDIVLGEAAHTASGLESMKIHLLELVVRAGLKDYGPAKKSLITKVKMKGSPPGYQYFAFPENDIRRTTNQAIANAYIFNYSTGQQELAKEWFHQSFVFLLPAATDDAATPREYSYKSQIIRFNGNFTGNDVKTTRFDMPEQVAKAFKSYSSLYFMPLDKEPGEHLLFLNDVFLGFLFMEYIQETGINGFTNAVKYNNSQVIKAAYTEKTRLMFENMCLVKLNGKTFEQLASRPADRKAEVLAMALFEYYSYIVYPEKPASSFTDEFFKRFETITGSKVTGALNKSIIPYYLAIWQKKVQAAIIDAKKKSPDGFLKVGAVLATTMGLY